MTPASLLKRASERRTEHLLSEILVSQGWDLRRAPPGNLLLQQEYRTFPHLAEILERASKKGTGYGFPEAILVDASSITPLAVIEAKADLNELGLAVREATHYATFFVEADYPTLSIAIAGTSEDEFELRVLKWSGKKWLPVTYDKEPIGWIPNPRDLIRIAAPAAGTELRPTVPPAEVLAARADEINRLLRESGISDQARPAVVGAIMLALWSSAGDLRKDKRYLLEDINRACGKAFWQTQKPELARSLKADEANEELAVKARRIVTILERLNVNVLTAEHDYLGQLYEIFFRYTGGNTIGQYFTPRHITHFMADLVEVGSDDVVLDPACGTGGFLIAAMERILKQRKLSRAQLVRLVKKRLVGFEKEPITAALCIANMVLRGDGSTGVSRDDCFTSKDFPEGKATVVLMNPPFPHKKTDVPSERFVERALEGLRTRGRLAVILPSSLLAKASRGKWREKILKHNSLVAVVQLPDELFQPYASSTTSIVMLEKGVSHDSNRGTVFVRVAYDGLTLKKGVRVVRRDGRNQLPSALDVILNKRAIPGFSGVASISGRAEWAVGAYIESAIPEQGELRESADVLLRRLASFYVRYAAEIMAQRQAVATGDIEVRRYREIVSAGRLRNVKAISDKAGTIGGLFDILYGMKELHSREGIPPGQTLIISPTEEYNGTYGWLAFEPALEPPFVTAAQTGSIGESFVQLEPCAVNDDCLVLLPRNEGTSLAALVIAAAVIRLERWRFTYGRKLTPSRICDFRLPKNRQLEKWITARLAEMQVVIDTALRIYMGEDEIDAEIARRRVAEIEADPSSLVRGDRLAAQLDALLE